MTRICFIGPGSMGLPMVRQLLRAGHEVASCTSRSGTRAELVAMGASLCSTPAEAADGAEACIVCVFSAAQLRDVLVGADGILGVLPRDTAVISHVTSSVRTVAELAEASERARVSFVDAPISGTALSIERGELTVLLGGGHEAVRTAAALVGPYADPVIATGPVGTATWLKLLNNGLFAANAQLVEAALRVAARHGFDQRLVTEVLSACTGTSGALAYLRQSDDRTFEAALAYLDKDVAALREIDGSSEFDVLLSVIDGGPLVIGPPREGP